MRTFVPFSIQGLIAVGAVTVGAWAQPAPAPGNIEKVYQQSCAACHGMNLEGGSGSALLGPTWKHGEDSDSLYRVIRDGVPNTAMVGFAALGDSTIRALAIYIREKAYAARSADRPEIAADPDGRYTSQKHNYQLETVVSGLETPWSIAWLPDGTSLVTERPGRLRSLDKKGKLSEPISGIPAVFANGQGGLLDVAVHPDYAKKGNGWIYLAYSDPQTVDGKNVSMTAIVRGRIKAGAWVDQQQIFKAPLEFYLPTQLHFGCRLVFDQGYLYFGIGERGRMEHAQDLTRPNGKIHRIFDDGRVPTDNPFAKEPGAFPTLWTYGNRNPQGLVHHPATGEIWETEHGPRGGDEVNLIQRGHNYGWPKTSYGMNYNGTPLTSDTTLPGITEPVMYWTPSIGACGLDVYTGKAFPAWQGNLLAGGLAKQEVHRLVVKDGKVVEREVIFRNHGRVRDVAVGPDGWVYVVLNAGPNEKGGRVVRLKPTR
ncbi:MAG TPA: PQQ-dependent sugar dehydrogenase [Opitutaceae bacterium]|nr:PQQ-dependent sugar dehydrogenase [Opitutaceae bacterium]